MSNPLTQNNMLTDTGSGGKKNPPPVAKPGAQNSANTGSNVTDTGTGGKGGTTTPPPVAKPGAQNNANTGKNVTDTGTGGSGGTTTPPASTDPEKGNYAAALEAALEAANKTINYVKPVSKPGALNGANTGQNVTDTGTGTAPGSGKTPDSTGGGADSKWKYNEFNTNTMISDTGTGSAPKTPSTGSAPKTSSTGGGKTPSTGGDKTPSTGGGTSDVDILIENNPGLAGPPAEQAPAEAPEAGAPAEETPAEEPVEDDINYEIEWRQQQMFDTIEDDGATITEKYEAMGELLVEKANAEVDEATREAIQTLNATLEEFTTVYNQERQKAAYSQAQASDNMVLRNAAAGDLGGIGNKLYSDEQADFDARITQIDLEQANLMSDTARQIADLIAKGEYQKAQNILDIGIANIQNMINEENQIISWKMSLANNLDNLDFDKMQFDEGVREYNVSLALNKLQLGLFSPDDAKTLGVSESQAQAFADRINALADYDLESARLSVEAATITNQAAREAAFMAKLDKGMFNEADAIALGIDPSQAGDYADYISTMYDLNQQEAEAELRNLTSKGSSGGGGGGGGGGNQSADPNIQALMDSGDYSGLYLYLLSKGYSNTEANSYIEYLQQENPEPEEPDRTVLDALNDSKYRTQFISELLAMGYSPDDAADIADQYSAYFDADGKKFSGSPEVPGWDVETPDEFIYRTTGPFGISPH